MRKMIIGAFAFAALVGVTASIVAPAWAYSCTTTCTTATLAPAPRTASKTLVLYS
jgi:hypothetical protein